MAHISAEMLGGGEAGEAALKTLRKFNIRHLEQLGSMLVFEQGREAVSRVVANVSTDYLREMVVSQSANLSVDGLASTLASNEPAVHVAPLQSSNAYGFENSAVDLRAGFLSYVPSIYGEQHGNLGLKSDHEIVTSALDKFARTTDTDQKEVLLYPAMQMPQPKDQGSRGTCVAFSLCSALSAFIEYHVPKFTRTKDFSEQYLYFRAKQLDANSDSEGTSLSCGLEALTQHGICSESALPYRDYVDWAQALLFDQSLALGRVTHLARGCRIKGSLHLPLKNRVEEIKRCLRRNIPVVVGVATFRNAWSNEFARFRGEIALPITEPSANPETEVLLDQADGGHAVCILGYVDEPENDPDSRPGGGGFIFKNSWGTKWAPNNAFGRGYGILPYAYVEKYCIDSCIITKVREG